MAITMSRLMDIFIVASAVLAITVCSLVVAGYPKEYVVCNGNTGECHWHLGERREALPSSLSSSGKGSE